MSSLGPGVCLAKREVRSIILLSKDGSRGMSLLTLYLNLNPILQEL